MPDAPVTVWHRGTVDLAAITALGEGSLSGRLGIRFVDFGGDWLTAEMPVDERTRQPFGLLHGGASAALAETVSSVAGTLTLDPAERYVVGMEINANHLRAVRGGFVRATATAEAIGRTTQVWTIRIVDDERRLACLSRATLAVRERHPTK